MLLQFKRLVRVLELDLGGQNNPLQSLTHSTIQVDTNLDFDFQTLFAKLFDFRTDNKEPIDY